MNVKKIASIAGVRPHFKEVLIHTIQPYDYGMSEVFAEMEMRLPDFTFSIGGGD